MSHVGVHGVVGHVTGTQQGDLGDKDLRAVNTEPVTAVQELYPSRKGASE